MPTPDHTPSHLLPPPAGPPKPASQPPQSTSPVSAGFPPPIQSRPSSACAYLSRSADTVLPLPALRTIAPAPTLRSPRQTSSFPSASACLPECGGWCDCRPPPPLSPPPAVLPALACPLCSLSPSPPPYALCNEMGYPLHSLSP